MSLYISIYCEECWDLLYSPSEFYDTLDQWWQPLVWYLRAYFFVGFVYVFSILRYYSTIFMEHYVKPTYWFLTIPCSAFMLWLTLLMRKIPIIYDRNVRFILRDKRTITIRYSRHVRSHYVTYMLASKSI